MGGRHFRPGPQRPALDAETLIRALRDVKPAGPGEAWIAVCPVCYLRAGGLASRRTGGKCARCPYDGPATVVSLLPIE